MIYFNAKATITRPAITSVNDLGEPVFGSPTTISTNTPCFFENRFRSIIYNMENKVPRNIGIASTESFSMYLGANSTIATGDNVAIDSVNYTVLSIITVRKLGTKKSHREVSLERVANA